MNKLIISNIFSTSWSVFKKNWKILIGVYLLFIVLSFIPYSFSFLIGEYLFLSFLIGVAIILFQFFLLAGFFKIFLDVHRGKEISVNMIFSQSHLFLRLTLVSLLYSVMTFIGFFLLIIPGIFITVKFFFVGLFLVDKNTGVMEAIRQGGRLTKGNWWSVFILVFIIALLNFIGFIAFIIGTLFTAPFGTMVMISAYRNLIEKPVEEVNQSLNEVNFNENI